MPELNNTKLFIVSTYIKCLTVVCSRLYSDAMNTQSELAFRLVSKIQSDNPTILPLFLDTKLSDVELVEALRDHYTAYMKQEYPTAWTYYTGEEQSEQDYYRLSARSMAYLRLMDYLDHEGASYPDWNLHGEEVVSRPISLMRKVLTGGCDDCNPDFLEDMAHLFSQLSEVEEFNIPTRSQVQTWMKRHGSGLDSDVVTWRAHNKERIVALLIEKLKTSERRSSHYIRYNGNS